MNGQELRAITEDAKAATGRLRTPYAALKSAVIEQTGKKRKRLEIRVSEEDSEKANLMADAMGISVSCLFRLLARVSFDSWESFENQATSIDEDEEDRAC